jgi:hypothetical protein
VPAVIGSAPADHRATTDGQRLHRVADRLGVTDELGRHRHPRPTGGRQHRLRHGLATRVHDDVRTVCGRPVALRRPHVHGDHGVRAHQLRDLHGVQPEAARTDHGDSLAGLDLGHVDERVERRRHRVHDDRADLERHAGGQRAEVAGWHHDVLGSELWARQMRVSGVFRLRNPAHVHLVEGDVTGARHERRALPRVTMVG